MKAEQSLFAADSITRKLHSDPAMAVGGIRALLQQALHPEAMAGVANNSNFREDTWGRLRRTGDYVALLTFGPIVQAESMAARVRAIHTKLGLDDPHLLLWVHMAMVDSFLDVAVRSGLALEPAERYLRSQNAHFRESRWYQFRFRSNNRSRNAILFRRDFAGISCQ